MGIKNLKPFLKKNVPEAFEEVPLTAFRGTRIAIDAHNYIYKMMARSQKQTMTGVNLRLDPTASECSGEKLTAWFSHIIKFIITLTSYGITPVFVFDGKHLPEKAKTQDKRRDDKMKIVNRRKELEEKLEKMDPLDRPDDLLDELRRLKASATYVPEENVRYLKNVLSVLGVPNITAYGDGEQLCTMLAHDGHVSAVFSADTDCMALGCRIFVYGFSKGKSRSNLHFDVVRFDPILRKLKLNKSEFVDLCIMAECDYNNNIPRVAITTAYKLLLQCRTIEDLPDKYDIEILNHQFCRDFFKTVTSEELLDEVHDGILPSLDMDDKAMAHDDSRNILRELNLEQIGMDLRSAMHNIGKIEHNAPVEGFGRVKITHTGMVIKLPYQKPPRSTFGSSGSSVAASSSCSSVRVNDPIQDFKLISFC